ncbi:MAG: FeoB-associated Cys-rich membrane protein [Tannerella sp.]|jgi:hypothetical protein|nr:FeoB-associated Cys-rich membrane protein [Tannerella sp.]
MWQEITVIITGIIISAYAGYKIYRRIKGGNASPCDSCAGCSLKEQLKDKSLDCEEQKIKKK